MSRIIRTHQSVASSGYAKIISRLSAGGLALLSVQFIVIPLSQYFLTVAPEANANISTGSLAMWSSFQIILSYSAVGVLMMWMADRLRAYLSVCLMVVFIGAVQGAFILVKEIQRFPELEDISFMTDVGFLKKSGDSEMLNVYIITYIVAGFGYLTVRGFTKALLRKVEFESIEAALQAAPYAAMQQSRTDNTTSNRAGTSYSPSSDFEADISDRVTFVQDSVSDGSSSIDSDSKDAYHIIHTADVNDEIVNVGQHSAVPSSSLSFSRSPYSHQSPTTAKRNKRTWAPTHEYSPVTGPNLTPATTYLQTPNVDTSSSLQLNLNSRPVTPNLVENQVLAPNQDSSLSRIWKSMMTNRAIYPVIYVIRTLLSLIVDLSLRPKFTNEALWVLILFVAHSISRTKFFGSRVAGAFLLRAWQQYNILHYLAATYVADNSLIYKVVYVTLSMVFTCAFAVLSLFGISHENPDLYTKSIISRWTPAIGLALSGDTLGPYTHQLFHSLTQSSAFGVSTDAIGFGASQLTAFPERSEWASAVLSLLNHHDLSGVSLFDVADFGQGAYTARPSIYQDVNVHRQLQESQNLVADVLALGDKVDVPAKAQVFIAAQVGEDDVPEVVVVNDALSLNSLVASPRKAKNVMLMMLEGFGGQFLSYSQSYVRAKRALAEGDDSATQLDIEIDGEKYSWMSEALWTPRIAEWLDSNGGLVLPNFITPTYHTIRGLYTTYCGDYDTLDATTCKGTQLLSEGAAVSGSPDAGMGDVKITPPPRTRLLEEEVVDEVEDRMPPGIGKQTTSPIAEASSHGSTCLPSILSRQGYSTHFLQGADLRFMNKDRIMPIIGYQNVLGAPELLEKTGMVPEYEYQWGLVDKTLYDATWKYIETELLPVKDEQPFFLSTLTVGTHYPFGLDPVMKEKLKQDGGDLMYAAIREMDNVITGFMEKMSGSGLLEDTMVIFVADESRGGRGVHHGGSWGSAVVVYPEAKEVGSKMVEQYKNRVNGGREDNTTDTIHDRVFSANHELLRSYVPFHGLSDRSGFVTAAELLSSVSPAHRRLLEAENAVEVRDKSVDSPHNTVEVATSDAGTTTNSTKTSATVNTQAVTNAPEDITVVAGTHVNMTSLPEDIPENVVVVIDKSIVEVPASEQDSPTTTTATTAPASVSIPGSGTSLPETFPETSTYLGTTVHQSVDTDTTTTVGIEQQTTTLMSEGSDSLVVLNTTPFASYDVQYTVLDYLNMIPDAITKQYKRGRSAFRHYVVPRPMISFSESHRHIFLDNVMCDCLEHCECALQNDWVSHKSDTFLVPLDVIDEAQKSWGIFDEPADEAADQSILQPSGSVETYLSRQKAKLEELQTGEERRKFLLTRHPLLVNPYLAEDLQSILSYVSHDFNISPFRHYQYNDKAKTDFNHPSEDTRFGRNFLGTQYISMPERSMTECTMSLTIDTVMGKTKAEIDAMEQTEEKKLHLAVPFSMNYLQFDRALAKDDPAVAKKPHLPSVAVGETKEIEFTIPNPLARIDFSISGTAARKATGELSFGCDIRPMTPEELAAYGLDGNEEETTTFGNSTTPIAEGDA